MSSNILSAPVTEFAFIKLKEGKESERGNLERYIGELQQEISTASGLHATSWAQSIDSGKENVYIIVLGWDSVADHWAAVGPNTPCGKIVENKMKPIADIELTHASMGNFFKRS